MTLEDLEGMGIPDNKGGRPTKEEEERKSPDYHGQPFRNGHGESFWKELWEENFTEKRNLRQAISKISFITHCLPRTVVHEIDRHDIYDFDSHEGEYDDYEEYLIEKKKKKRSSSGSRTRSGTGDGGSGGLSSLIKDEQ